MGVVCHTDIGNVFGKSPIVFPKVGF